MQKGTNGGPEHVCCGALNTCFHVDWLTAFVQYRSEISQPSNAFETRRQLRSQRVGSFSLTHLESSFFIDAFCLCYLFCHLQFVFCCKLSQSSERTRQTELKMDVIIKFEGLYAYPGFEPGRAIAPIPHCNWNCPLNGQGDNLSPSKFTGKTLKEVHMKRLSSVQKLKLKQNMESVFYHTLLSHALHSKFILKSCFSHAQRIVLI